MYQHTLHVVDVSHGTDDSPELSESNFSIHSVIIMLMSRVQNGFHQKVSDVDAYGKHLMPAGS